MVYTHGVDTLEFAIALEAPYERSYTGPVLFSIDCSTLL